MNGGDASLAKELGVRRRIKSVYNKSEDDFPSLRDYNDYLEEVEDIIFNLVEGVDVQATEARVRQYEAENRDQILAARARKAQERSSALRAAQQQRTAGGGGGTATALTTIQQDGNGAGASLPDPFVLPQPLTVGTAAGTAGVPAVAVAAAAPPRPIGLQPAPVQMRVESESLARLTREQQAERHRRGLKAAGWSQELVKMRFFEEAFGGLWVEA